MTSVIPTGQSRSRGRPWPVAMSLVCTGGAWVAAQVAWTHWSVAQAGADALVGVIALAASMLGLAAGSALAARRLARIAPATLLRVQLLACAAAMLVSPWAIDVLTRLAVAASAGRSLAAGETFVGGAIALILFVLNAPFGLALPAATAWDGATTGRHATARGAVATTWLLVGATIGVAVFGLLLPPRFGLTWCVVIAAGVLVACLAIPSTRRQAAAARMADPPAAEPGEISTRSVLWLSWWMGAASLSALLLWVRGLIFFAPISNASVVLGAVLVFALAAAVGVLAGAAILPAQRRPGQFLAGTALLAAIATAASGAVLSHLPTLMPQYFNGDLSLLPIRAMLAATLVLAVPAMFIGLSLPGLYRLLCVATNNDARLDSPVQAGRLAGRLTRAFLLGAAIAPLGIAATLSGLLDSRRSLLAASVAFMLAGLWSEMLDPATGWHRSSARATRPSRHEPDHPRHERLRQAKRYRIPIANILLFIAAAGACYWQSEQGSLFQPACLIVNGHAYDERAATNTFTLPTLVESPGGAVAVRRGTFDGVTQLLIDRRPRGDDSPESLRAQHYQALLPLMLAGDTPRRALVIGLGTGVVPADLTEAGVAEVTVAEPVQPAINAGLDNFAAVNNNLRSKVVTTFAATQPATQPATPAEPQVRIVHIDARLLLRLDPTQYDLIVMPPADPRDLRYAHLFTQEFYELAKSRLTEHGLFVQWVPLWQGPAWNMAEIVSAAADAATGASGMAAANLADPARPTVGMVISRGGRVDASAGRLAAAAARLAPAIRRLGAEASELNLSSPAQVQATLATLGKGVLSYAAARTDDAVDLGAARDRAAAAVWPGLNAGLARCDVEPPPAAAVLDSYRLLAKASAAIANRQHAEAESLLQQAVAADSRNAAARLYLNQWKQLVAAEAVRQQWQAMQSAAEGHPPLAPEQLIDDLTRADELYPAGVVALALKVDLLRQARRLDDAVAAATELTARAPRSADFWFVRALLLVEQAKRQPREPAMITLQDAQQSLSAARQLRAGNAPRAYAALAVEIRMLIAPPATQPTSGKE